MSVLLIAPLEGTAPAIYPTSFTGVPAGFPSPAQDYSSTSLDLNEILIRDRAATFILRVFGDSMIGAGISDGDEIIVDRSIQAQNGAIIVAALDGEFTVKRFYIDPYGQGWLHPENPNYPALRIEPNSDFEVFGVVTRCLHHVA